MDIEFRFTVLVMPSMVRGPPQGTELTANATQQAQRKGHAARGGKGGVRKEAGHTGVGDNTAKHHGAVHECEPGEDGKPALVEHGLQE